MELKKQTTTYQFGTSESSFFSTQILSELVAQQGVTQDEIIGRKVYQKYHNLRMHVSYGDAGNTYGGSIKIRVVLAWRQNKIGETYGNIIGNPALEPSALFPFSADPSLRLIQSYVNGNNGTYHVVYDKVLSLNKYTNDVGIVNIYFDKNRPINLEPTRNPGEYHDGNRQFILLVMTDDIEAFGLNCVAISEIGYYDP